MSAMKLRMMLLGAFLIIGVCSISSMGLETKLYSLCEHNLSINLTPDFRIVGSEDTESSDGIFLQDFTISGSGSGGIATLQVIDIYDETLRALDPIAISQLFSNTMSTMAAYLSVTGTDSENIVGNWSTIDSNGKNVTINTMNTKGTPLSMFGKTVDIAYWNVKENKYAGIISCFDKSITRQIINTLQIK